MRAAPKRNYTGEDFWILSLWNPISFVPCFWQTENILRMGQGSFKGIPAGKIKSHFEKPTATFFHVRLGRYDNWVLKWPHDKNARRDSTFPKQSISLRCHSFLNLTKVHNTFIGKPNILPALCLFFLINIVCMCICIYTNNDIKNKSVSVFYLSHLCVHHVWHRHRTQTSCLTDTA